jgi:hypothetical protein
MNDRPSPDGNDQDRELLEGDDPGLNIAVLRRRREWGLTIAAVLVVIAVSVYIAYRVTRPAPVVRAELETLAKQAVRRALPGRVLQFAGPEEMTFSAQGDTGYEVKGGVLAITTQGTTESYLFTCNLERVPNGSWRWSKLEVNPLYVH